MRTGQPLPQPSPSLPSRNRPLSSAEPYAEREISWYHHIHLGEIHVDKEWPWATPALHHLAHEILQKSETPLRILVILHYPGIVYRLKDDYDNAIDCLNRFITDYISITKETVALVLNNTSGITVEGPCKEFNDDIANALDAKPNMKSRGTQYSILDITVKKCCIICGELFKKGVEVLTCRISSCKNSMHVRC
ncbi:unnamed protein product [Didymodactylos carnosus]|uniref:Uncharacterized protein n=1 Tax=Didymodactylos carnosus TaxID=1234261 RepID=A0A814GQV0_9BILA|nr:unnamed protein product [Didymodactylos carnosus]CAF3771059.1 unnamed protein product [Didymodactylos carnosus]